MLESPYLGAIEVAEEESLASGGFVNPKLLVRSWRQRYAIEVPSPR